MIKKLGVMLDCSRNSVMTVEGVKRFMLNMEKMGYNLLQLYTEDTYEIPEEPLFGHFRGRYSQAEIRELDAFAKEHGIELQACIQTLAHLEQIFKWDRFGAVRDTTDILLAEDQNTYDLIDNMFKSVADSYTSKCVNIGMDEAMLLGAGQYYHKNGYKKRFDILMDHLVKVSEMARKYDFKLYMWSDMFFRLVNEGLYYPENGEKCKVVPKEIRDRLPDNVILVYWDYYHENKGMYDDMLDRHFDFGREVAFAGGAWKWIGFGTGNKRTFTRIDKAIMSCQEKGVEEFTVTMWGDNGNESPANAMLPALLYASECVKGNFGMKNLKTKFKEVFGESFEDFMLLDMRRPDMDTRCWAWSCGAKELMYSDTFLGKYDSTIVGDETQYFVDMEKKFRRAKNRSQNYSYIFASYEKLCKALKVKYDLGFRTRNAYSSGDKEKLKLIIKDFERAIKYIEEFIVYFRKMWFTDSKPHGFDVQDLRLGGVIQRLKANRQRLIEYVNGEVPSIPELEEKLVNVLNGDNPKLVPTCNSFTKIASANVI